MIVGFGIQPFSRLGVGLAIDRLLDLGAEVGLPTGTLFEAEIVVTGGELLRVLIVAIVVAHCFVFDRGFFEFLLSG